MRVLGIILARAGSKGLPGKNVAMLNGRPMIAWTIDHALNAKCLDRVVVSTDGDAIAQAAREASENITIIRRPDVLANDTATVDAAARHALAAVESFDCRDSIEAGNTRSEGGMSKEHDECLYDAVVILYGNVPLRPSDLIDNAVAKLQTVQCDSVQSVSPVGKMHPYWMKTLGSCEGVPANEKTNQIPSELEGDRLEHYQANHIYRRQDLPPVYMLDGGIIVVARESLHTVVAGEPHAFLGSDRRAVVTEHGAVVDVDGPEDFLVAQAAMSVRYERPETTRNAFADHVYVIAELGVNHDGSVDKAISMARSARAAGADAVKLQLFDPQLLLSAEAKLAIYQKESAQDPFEMLEQLQLSVEQMLQVKAVARELGMGFIVTPFSCELLEEMRTLNPDVVKIAGPDCVNTPLIETMLLLNKPMIISTGTATIGEVMRHDQLWRRVPQLTFLHCVSSYPTPSEYADLHMIAQWAQHADNAGYSDHTANVYTGGLAVAAGARVLEKHLTYDSNAQGPDHATSLEPSQFKEYVAFVRLAEQMNGCKNETDIQSDVRLVSRQSLCATRNLNEGDVLTREDITVKRPGNGILASKLGNTLGKTLLRDVKVNHLLYEGDV